MSHYYSQTIFKYIYLKVGLKTTSFIKFYFNLSERSHQMGTFAKINIYVPLFKLKSWGIEIRSYLEMF